MTHELQNKLEEKLADYVEDAHALEDSVVDNLDSMIGTIDDPKLKELLQRHRQTSREHVERLKRRLEQLDRGTPVRKRIEGMALALMKSVSDILRTDAPGKVGRDAYLLAHTQIAAYELLSRLADAAGDAQTAELARTNLADEKSLADELTAHWDDFIEVTVGEWRRAAAHAPVASGTPTV
jgi:ferritin-like metal-binding protein YciE